MKHSALVTTAPIFQPKGVSVLFTSSITDKNHWSARLLRLQFNGRLVVKPILQMYMCAECISSGERHVCVHRKHLVPNHIDGTEGNPVKMLMELLQAGSYELECLGVSDFQGTHREILFTDESVDKLSRERINLTSDVILSNCSEGLLLTIDPTPSNKSGVGLVGCIVRGGVRIVSIRVSLVSF